MIHNYLGKYKEKLLGLIASPRCYYNQYLDCFVSLTPEMSYQVGLAEVLTSCDQLQDLAEICGTEGMVWFTGQIQKDIAVDLANLLKIVQVFRYFYKVDSITAQNCLGKFSYTEFYKRQM